MKMPATYDRMHRREEPPPPVSVRTLMEKIILEEYAPPAVVFNSRYDILYLLGDTVKYLGMPKGEPSYNLFNLINEDLRPKLLTLLHRAVAGKKAGCGQVHPLPAR